MRASGLVYSRETSMPLSNRDQVQANRFQHDSVRGYAVAIGNRDEAMAAAREASGERVAEVDGEMTRETFDELHLKPGEVKCIFESHESPSRTH
jgi:hypothetical protein